MCRGDENDFFRGGGDGEALEFEPEPAFDDAYRLLGDRRRRALLYLLSESDVQIQPVAWLEARLESLEGDSGPGDVGVELRHKHLPKLADTGVIEYDPRSEAVVYLGDERVETLLKPAMDRELRTD